MKLTLQRDTETAKGTTGRLFVDGAPFCVTLERPAERYGGQHPCIPAGEYRVVLYRSPHFGRLMPLLEGVPARGGIEIHWGNFVGDFQGCIGVGASRSNLPDGSPAIWNTREVFDKLFATLKAERADGCTIIIRDAPVGAEQGSRMFADGTEISAPRVHSDGADPIV